MSKNHTITKELVMEDIIAEFGEEKGKRIFNYLKVQQIIKKKSNKYYFLKKLKKARYIDMDYLVLRLL